MLRSLSLSGGGEKGERRREASQVVIREVPAPVGAGIESARIKASGETEREMRKVLARICALRPWDLSWSVSFHGKSQLWRGLAAEEEVPHLFCPRGLSGRKRNSNKTG